MIELHDQVESITGEWEDLAERTDAPPFSRPRWFIAWHQAFGRGSSLGAVTERRDGRLTGALALTYRRGAIEAPTNWHTPLFDVVSEDGEGTSRLLRRVLRERPRRVDFSFVRGDSSLLDRALATAAELGHPATSRVIERSPYIAVEGDWESFEARLSAKRRSNLRRCHRRLEERGSVSIEVSDGSRRLERELAEGLAVEASGWKAEHGTAIVSSAATRRFYSDVARWAADRGWLRLWFLRLDGRAIGFAYTIEYGGSVYELKIGYDVAFASYAPGVLLTRARLEHAFSSGLRSYEFLGQPEPHKLEWTQACRELTRLQIFAPTPAGWASRQAWTHGRRLAKRALSLANR